MKKQFIYGRRITSRICAVILAAVCIVTSIPEETMIARAAAPEDIQYELDEAEPSVDVNELVADPTDVDDDTQNITITENDETEEGKSEVVDDQETENEISESIDDQITEKVDKKEDGSNCDYFIENGEHIFTDGVCVCGALESEQTIEEADAEQAMEEIALLGESAEGSFEVTIGGVAKNEYTTLKEAFAAVTEGTTATIKLTSDVTVSDGNAPVLSSGTLTLDLNGKTLTVGGPGNWTSGTSGIESYGAGLCVCGNGAVLNIIGNGKITAKDDESYYSTKATVSVLDDATLNFESGTILGKTGVLAEGAEPKIPTLNLKGDFDCSLEGVHANFAKLYMDGSRVKITGSEKNTSHMPMYGIWYNAWELNIRNVTVVGQADMGYSSIYGIRGQLAKNIGEMPDLPITGVIDNVSVDIEENGGASVYGLENVTQTSTESRKLDISNINVRINAPNSMVYGLQTTLDQNAEFSLDTADLDITGLNIKGINVSPYTAMTSNYPVVKVSNATLNIKSNSEKCTSVIGIQGYGDYDNCDITVSGLYRYSSATAIVGFYNERGMTDGDIRNTTIKNSSINVTNTCTTTGTQATGVYLDSNGSYSGLPMTFGENVEISVNAKAAKAICKSTSGTNSYSTATGLSWLDLSGNTVNPENVAYAATGKGISADDPYLIIDTATKTVKGLTEAGKNQTEIVIPNGIQIIGKQAFFHDEKLTSISLPGSLTSIKSEAFLGCTGLTQVTIPKNVTSVEGSTFTRCTGLTRVDFKASKLTDANKMFDGCTSIQTFTLPSDMTYVPKSLLRGATLNNTAIEIPAGVTKIGEYAFNGTGGTATITFKADNKLTEIESNAFSGCTCISKINIPSTVTKIHGEAFTNATKLTGIELPSTLTFIGKNAFDGCSSLVSLSLDSNPTTELGGYVFDKCAISTLTLGSGVTKINTNIFKSADFNNCDIVIPKQVTTICDQAFLYVSGIRSITFEEGSKLTSIGKDAFGLDKTTESAGCNTFTTLEFPSGLKTIGEGAFADVYKYSAINKIVIPASVTSIGNDAFKNVAVGAKFYVTDGSYADTWVKNFIAKDENKDNNYKICKTCSISYVLNGGTAATGNPQSFALGEDGAIVINAPSREGYDFTGWYADKSCSKQILSEDSTYLELTGITSNLTLYAGWAKLLTVTSNSDASAFQIATRVMRKNSANELVEISPESALSFADNVNITVRQGDSIKVYITEKTDIRISSVQYKVGKIVKTAEAKDDSARGCKYYQIDNISAATVLSVGYVVRYKGVELVGDLAKENLTYTITGSSTAKDETTGWYVSEASANLTFTVTAKPEYLPQIILSSFNVEPVTGDVVYYSSFVTNKNGTYTYGYSIPKADVKGKFVAITANSVPTREVHVIYNSDQISVGARVGARQQAPTSTVDQVSSPEGVSTYATATYSVPVGSTIVITPTVLENCSLTGATYKTRTGEIKNKKASEYTIKPTQEIGVELTSVDNYQAAIWNSQLWSKEEYCTVTKNSITVDAEKEYVALIRKGSGKAVPESGSTANYDTAGRIVLMNGKTQISASTAGKAELTLPNLRTYAGKTLTLVYYANGSTKATNTYKVVVKGAASQVSSVTVSGAKKNVITQTAGTTKTYAVTVKPATVNLKRVYARLFASDGTTQIDDGNAGSYQFSFTDRYASDGKVDIHVKSTATANDSAVLKFFYQTGNNKSSEDPQVATSGTITIKAETDTYTKATPGVKLSSATDTELLLTLSLPKGISSNTKNLYYAVSATPVIDKGKTLATGMVDKYPKGTSTVEYVPVTDQTQPYTMVVGETIGEGVTRGTQKYNVSAYLVLSKAATVSGNPEADSNLLAKSKTALLKNATNRIASYASKLSVSKGNVKFYAGQITKNIVSENGILVATVKYDNKSTIHELERIEITDPDGNITYADGSAAFTAAGENHLGINVSGETRIYLRVSDSVVSGATNDSEFNAKASSGVKPGNYTLTAYAKRNDPDAKKVVASIKFTVLDPITKITVITPSETILKQYGKANTIKPSVIYESYNGGAKPSAKKVRWELIFPGSEYPSYFDVELEKYVSINSKTGAVTISKNYVIPADKMAVFAIAAYATDYSGNEYVYGGKAINLKTEAAKPDSTKVTCYSGEAATDGLNNGDSLKYNKEGFDYGKVVIKDADGNILTNGDFAFKSSNAAIKVTSDGTSTGAGIITFVPGKKITKETKVTITATATDGSGYKTTFVFNLVP